MKQIYIEGCYGNGYSRFMQYVNNVINHPTPLKSNMS